MILHRKDIEKINGILEKFPDVETFELEQSGHSGIGSITTMTFSYEVNGMRGSFDIEISGVEDW
jgi:hypothetical protein